MFKQQQMATAYGSVMQQFPPTSYGATTMGRDGATMMGATFQQAQMLQTQNGGGATTLGSTMYGQASQIVPAPGAQPTIYGAYNPQTTSMGGTLGRQSTAPTQYGTWRK
jgi:hypothetical protein